MYTPALIDATLHAIRSTVRILPGHDAGPFGGMVASHDHARNLFFNGGTGNVKSSTRNRSVQNRQAQ